MLSFPEMSQEIEQLSTIPVTPDSVSKSSHPVSMVDQELSIQHQSALSKLSYSQIMGLANENLYLNNKVLKLRQLLKDHEREIEHMGKKDKMKKEKIASQRLEINNLKNFIQTNCTHQDINADSQIRGLTMDLERALSELSSLRSGGSGSVTLNNKLVTHKKTGATASATNRSNIPPPLFVTSEDTTISVANAADILQIIHSEMVTMDAELLSSLSDPHVTEASTQPSNPVCLRNDGLEGSDNVLTFQKSRNNCLMDFTNGSEQPLISSSRKRKTTIEEDSLESSSVTSSTNKSKRRIELDVNESSSQRVDSCASLVTPSTDLNELFHKHYSDDTIGVTKKKSHKKKKPTKNVTLADDSAQQERRTPHKTQLTEDHVHKVACLPSLKILRDHCVLVVHAISSENKELSASLKYILTQVSVENVNTQEILINEGVVQKLVQFIAANDTKKSTLIDSLKIINTLIAISTPPQFVEIMSFDALLPRLVNMVDSSTAEVLEQVVWTLDNIAQDFGVFRQQMLDRGVLSRVVNVIASKSTEKNTLVLLVSLLNHLTDCTTALVPTLNEEHVKQMVVVLAPVLRSPFTDATVVHACCVLTNITHNEGVHRAMAVLSVFECSGLTANLIKIAQTSNTASFTQLHALNVLCNLSESADEQQVKQLVEQGFLVALTTLLSSKTALITSTACHALSHLCAESVIIQLALDAGLFQRLNALAAETKSDQNVRREAVNALMCGLQGATPDQTRSLIDCGSLTRVVASLKVGKITTKNKHATCAALDCLTTVLCNSTSVVEFDHVARSIDAAGGWKIIECLRVCKVEEVRELAVKLNRDQLRAEYLE